jgi:hypothetical protein
VLCPCHPQAFRRAVGAVELLLQIDRVVVNTNRNG